MYYVMNRDNIQRQSIILYNKLYDVYICKLSTMLFFNMSKFIKLKNYNIHMYIMYVKSNINL